MPELFKSNVTAHFRHADPAGILFFAQIFNFAHDHFESFIQHCKVPWQDWFNNATYAVPIKHTEADYKKPIKAGQSLQVQLRVIDISTTSFKVEHRFCDDSHTYAIVKMVHIFIDKKNMAKMAIPENIKLLLNQYLHPEDQNG